MILWDIMVGFMNVVFYEFMVVVCIDEKFKEMLQNVLGQYSVKIYDVVCVLLGVESFLEEIFLVIVVLMINVFDGVVIV